MAQETSGSSVRRRGRPSAELVDATPLSGSAVDVGVRIGVSSLSRLEAGQRVSNDLVEGYETVLRLRPGRLRGPIDALLRTHGGEPIERRRPGPPSLEEWSVCHARVSVGEPRGID